MYSIPNTPPLRDSQFKTIEETFEAFDRGFENVIIQAPTGTGKTLMARYFAERFDSTLIGVPSRALQDQYADELIPTGNVAVLKGKANYLCGLNPELTVPEARCQYDTSGYQVKECYSNSICEYLEKKAEAEESKITVLSFAGQIAWTTHVPDFFGRRELHIIDEAHKMEDIVRDQFQIQQSESAIRKSFGKNKELLPPMPVAGHGEVLLNYLRECARVANIRLQELLDIYKCEDLENLYMKAQDQAVVSKNLMPVLNLKNNIDLLFRKTNEDSGAYATYIEQLFDKTSKKMEPHIVSKPVHLQELVKEYVMGHKTVFMSATLVGVKRWAQDMGIENYHFINVPSNFPAKNRKVWFVPVGALSQRTESELTPKIVSFVKRLASKEEFKTSKGLIHTSSYRMNQSIKAGVEDERFVFSEQGKVAEALSEHVHSGRPTILVGPSFKEGIDLKENLCRFQVVVKAGFSNPTNPLVVMKKKADPTWDDRRIISDFIQQIGRGIRSKTDWAVTYVLDENLRKVLLKHRKYVPDYVWESFQNIE